jgi:hypothetical protein
LDGLPQPEGLPADWGKLSDDQKRQLANARQVLRLGPDDLARLTRGEGRLPPAYARWAAAAVEQQAFWEKNYLSTDVRIPVTLTRTNSARAMATNALHGHMWEDFASETYKALDPVGRVSYRDPFSGAERSFPAPADGPGYYRVPTLISAWATAPFLHNNALGLFNNDPSVKGRLAAFDDGIAKLLWPERRVGHTAADVIEPNATHKYLWPKRSDSKEPKTRNELSPQEVKDAAERVSEQLRSDGGLVWRTSHESWFMIYGHSVPVLFAGLTGWAPFWVRVVPWLPSVAFVVLGIALLLSESLGATQDHLRHRFPRLSRLFVHAKGLGATVAFVLAAVAVWFAFTVDPTLEMIAAAAEGAPPLLRLQAYLPALFFAALGTFFAVQAYRGVSSSRQLARVTGALCLLAAVVLALSFGRFLSGYGSDVKFGPVPAGVPVNVLANMNPDAPAAQKLAAREALIRFVSDCAKDPKVRENGLQVFGERAAPALMDASKCPDFVMDRGHDYVFIRDLSDQEKKELIELIKTF